MPAPLIFDLRRLAEPRRETLTQERMQHEDSASTRDRVYADLYSSEVGHTSGSTDNASEVVARVARLMGRRANADAPPHDQETRVVAAVRPTPTRPRDPRTTEAGYRSPLDGRPQVSPRRVGAARMLRASPISLVLYSSP